MGKQDDLAAFVYVIAAELKKKGIEAGDWAVTPKVSFFNHLKRRGYLLNGTTRI